MKPQAQNPEPYTSPKPYDALNDSWGRVGRPKTEKSISYHVVSYALKKSPYRYCREGATILGVQRRVGFPP